MLAGVHHAFAAGPGTGADVFITLVPGVERFDYFRMLHFVDSPEW